jgi:hypothetical protein
MKELVTKVFPTLKSAEEHLEELALVAHNKWYAWRIITKAADVRGALAKAGA